MHGNEIDQFHNSDKIDEILWPILYVGSVIPIFLFARNQVKKLKLSRKILTIGCLMILAFIPVLLLSGLIKYVDYYSTPKEWKVIEGVITHKTEHSNGRGNNSYSYTIKTKDTILILDSGLRYSTGDKLHLKIAKTNLGTLIANTYQ